MPPEKTVLVLGAGFTKAFFPAAPTLIDDFGCDTLLEKYARFPRAARILQAELDRFGDGRVNLERLMTRLDSKMPYDFRQGRVGDFDELLQDLLDALVDRIGDAEDGERDFTAMKTLATYCIRNGVDCITFNYDEFFDRALFEAGFIGDHRWSPDDGYGFYCRHALRLFYEYESYWNASTNLLLKLHGSLNWFAKLGAPRPYMLDSIVHSEDWFKPQLVKMLPEAVTTIKINTHLEPRPVIIAPVLDKTVLREQPVMRRLWEEAARILNGARRVIFVGYSLPQTDLAARSLFAEFIRPDKTGIEVVDYCPNRNQNGERNGLIASYNDTFPGEVAFSFDGALAWSRRFIGQSPL